MGKRDDYLWHGMILHYFFVWLIVIVFLYFKGAAEILTLANIITLLFVIIAADLLVHEIIKTVKIGTK